MAFSQIHLIKPTFTLHPDALPLAIPPPAGERSFRAPFGIDPWLYESALRPEVPLVFASLYIVGVFSLNAFNRSRQWKPWWIARQWWFNWLVVIHNALLTIYSVATFLAIARALAVSVPNLFAPDTTVASVADSICKMNGPRGFGDAVTYNTTINIWESKNSLIRTAVNGQPDPTDVGRIWNEGLSFWGWFFYMSKFYEVLDTAIILAKGKRSATLQTYHHSGAMLCMWAGIRYMSPPIMMFVLVNSLIHALMYTYFTLSALGVRVPPRLKRTLTTMQIGQFLWGATYASAHLFIQYEMPVATSYQIASTVKAAVASVSSAAAAAATSGIAGVSQILESPSANGALAATFKKLLLRAAGEEGIAELVGYQKSEPAVPILAQIENKIEQTKTIFTTHWRTDNTRVNCIDTTGQMFAIYLNLFYLAPLTFLFARFFVKAYTRWGKSSKTQSPVKHVVEATKEAKERTELAVEQIGTTQEEELRQAEQELEQTVEKGIEDIRAEFRKDMESFKSGTFTQNIRNVTSSSTSFFTSEQTSSEQTSSEQTSSEQQSSTQQSSEQTASELTSSEQTASEQALEQTSTNHFSSEQSTSEEITSTTHFEAHDQSKTQQESNLEISQDIRPGIEDDTDAMGRSGAIVMPPQDDADSFGLLPPSPGKE